VAEELEKLEPPAPKPGPEKPAGGSEKI
jgi:hypothetical protein